MQCLRLVEVTYVLGLIVLFLYALTPIRDKPAISATKFAIQFVYIHFYQA
jgi:hypothetical protein